MPSLRLSNRFRRGADRPSLKERAAALRATAARVIRRRPAARLDPDAELLRLGDELIVAWADEIDPAHDETRFEAATARSSAIVDQIEALTPATLDGLIVKAVAVSWCHCGEAVTGECFDEQPTTDLNLCAGIVRDLLAMRAGPPLPQPKGA